MKYFVTGGAGFIGSNFIHYALKTYQDAEVLNYDLLTYAGNLSNLKQWEGNSRYGFVQGDIRDYDKLSRLFETYRPDVVVNFAAESHNDRGEMHPRIFFETNVLGTEILLEAVRDASAARGKPIRFHHISTCEVFGDLPLESDPGFVAAPKAFLETSRYNPKTPYNASKACSDHVVTAFYHTFGVQATISNCANNYGPYQYPEKVLPLFITNALEGKQFTIFKSSKNKREWTHVLDHCSAIDLIIKRGKPGEFYNVGSGVEKTVEEMADAVIKRLLELNKIKDGESLKAYVPDRRQHDRRYLLDSEKIKSELGWKPKYDGNDGFLRGMNETIDWYAENDEWWTQIKNSQEFKEYYEKKYC